MFRWLLLLALLAAVIVGLAIGVLNPDQVAFNFVFYQGHLPLGALMLLCFFFGVLLSWLLVLLSRLIRFGKRTPGKS